MVRGFIFLAILFKTPFLFALPSVNQGTLSGDQAKGAPKANADSANQRPSTVGAASKAPFTCADLRKANVRLVAHGTNLINQKTTRTQSGKPYSKRLVQCGALFCEMQEKLDVRKELLPSHPDADLGGYVQFPNINVGEEYAALNSAATELKLLALNGTCDAVAITSDRSMLIKYGSSFDVTSDTLSFDADGRLRLWSRHSKDGSLVDVAFKDDGTLAR